MRISDWSSDVCSSDLILGAQRFPVETVLFVADLLHRPADGGLDLVKRTRRPGAIFIDALAAEPARQHDELGRGQRIARDARLRVFRQEQIDDRIRKLVRNLVGMPFGHASGRYAEVVASGMPSLYCV